jgi:hypothetical protein
MSIYNWKKTGVVSSMKLDNKSSVYHPMAVSKEKNQQVTKIVGKLGTIFMINSIILNIDKTSYYHM